MSVRLDHVIAGAEPELIEDFSDSVPVRPKPAPITFRVMERDPYGAVEALEDWNAAVAASVMRYNPRAAKGR